MGRYSDELFKKLEDGRLTFRWREDELTRDLAKYIAMHDNDHETLKQIRPGWKPGRLYKVDPLPSRINSAFADFLYGEDPIIEPKKPSNLERLNDLVEANDLVQTYWEGVDMCSAEGETYFRVYNNKSQSDHPIIDFHSRSMTVPLFRGRALMAVAFISVVYEDEKDALRYVEVHEAGEVQNRLYKSSQPGSDDGAPNLGTGLGSQVPLSEADETRNLDPFWAHSLPMLAGRIPNKLGRDRRMGISDYRGVDDLLLDLNETHTIDAENYRLAGKKRAVMSERYASESGNVDSAEEIFFTKEGWDEMENGEDGPFKILEYDYDAEAAIARKSDLTKTIFSRVGIVPDFNDPGNNESHASSGVARRFRLMPTELAAKGKSRRWDGSGPYILMLAQQLDALSESEGGWGRGWEAPGDIPIIKRGSILPEDDEEKHRRVGGAITAGTMSLVTALRELHPRWSEKQISDEAAAIRKDQELPQLGSDKEGSGDD